MTLYGRSFLTLLDYTPDEIRHIPPACGQGGIVAIKVEHLPAQRPGGIHIADPFQLEQRHLPLRTDGKDLIRLAALRRRVQTTRFFQKIHPVAPKLQLHFPAHTVGGNNFSGFQILLHCILLQQKRPLAARAKGQ